ncbi:MAG: hypothetical protein U9R15_12520, partial [Chloroflexota bacterium]|nr:hypothetical protein [Chloroflexota bacterium]
MDLPAPLGVYRAIFSPGRMLKLTSHGARRFHSRIKVVNGTVSGAIAVEGVNMGAHYGKIEKEAFLSGAPVMRLCVGNEGVGLFQAVRLHQFHVTHHLAGIPVGDYAPLVYQNHAV